MSVEAAWDSVQPECLVISYNNPWTWEEFNSAYASMISMLDDAGGDQKFTLIIDIRKGGYPPPDALPRFKRVVETKHPNVAQLIFVAPATMTHFIRLSMDVLKRVYRTVGKANPPEFQFVTSLEEARKLSNAESSTVEPS